MSWQTKKDFRQNHGKVLEYLNLVLHQNTGKYNNYSRKLVSYGTSVFWSIKRLTTGWETDEQRVLFTQRLQIFLSFTLSSPTVWPT
jgi:hypothetical protein